MHVSGYSGVVVRSRGAKYRRMHDSVYGGVMVRSGPGAMHVDSIACQGILTHS